MALLDPSPDDSDSQIMLSVIIRNRNESEYLQSVLSALSKQDTSHEVILVDNNSTDGSRELALRYNAKVITIDDFTYGRALNLGIRAAVGEICVILSAHSLPLGPSFLAQCAKPFTDDRVAAARCVYAGKAADVLRWLEPEALDGSDDFISKGILASGCVIRRCNRPIGAFIRGLIFAPHEQRNRIDQKEVLCGVLESTRNNIRPFGLRGEKVQAGLFSVR